MPQMSQGAAIKVANPLWNCI